MIRNTAFRCIVFALVLLGMLSRPAFALSGYTIYSPTSGDMITRTRSFPAKTPELDITYQRTMRTAASKVAVAAAVRGALRSFVDKIPVIGSIALLAVDLYGIWNKKPDGTNELIVTPLKNGTEYSVNGGPYGPSALGACSDYLAKVVDRDFTYIANSATDTSCQVYITSNKDGTRYVTQFAVSSRSSLSASVPHPLRDDELEIYLKNSPQLAPILKQLDDLGQPVDFPEPEVEVMPQPIPISPVTTTHPDGSKTIESTTLEPYQDTPDGDVKWRKKTTLTEISKPASDGSTSTTTATTTTDKGQSSSPAAPDKPPEEPAKDTPLPDQPTLYKQKYPDGMTGVWKNQKDILANSPLFTIVKQLMPSVGLNGSCPSFPINFSFATWANFGIKDVAPPCQIWDWGRAICIVGACLAARKMIFGG